jgi:hypothetical protein
MILYFGLLSLSDSFPCCSGLVWSGLFCSVLFLRFSILYSRFSILNSPFLTLDSRLLILDSRFSILSPDSCRFAWMIFNLICKYSIWCESILMNSSWNESNWDGLSSIQSKRSKTINNQTSGDDLKRIEDRRTEQRAIEDAWTVWIWFDLL